MLEPRSVIRFPAETKPKLLVVIDTEEEFDWSKPRDRRETSVRAIRATARVQEVCEQFGIRPTYALDYPVAAQPDGIDPLKPLFDAGRADPAAHLHPWVNPPHEEEVCAHNSYPGNLPAELERRKLQELTHKIADAFGKRPLVYKAGRYGVGPHTADILAELGYEVDLSVCPPFDRSADGGPDFTRSPTEPYWLGNGRLLEIPLTGTFVGFLGAWGRPVYGLANRAPLRALRMPGILARLRAVDRLRLSPEVFTPTEHRKLTRFLLRRGVRTFTFTFHSPSLQPGCTPYVKTERDLEDFLEACRSYFEFFFGKLQGVATTPLELKRELDARDA